MHSHLRDFNRCCKELSTVAIKSIAMSCSVADQCSGFLTLEISCIFLVAVAACTQTTRLCFQTSVLLYGVCTDKKGKGEASCSIYLYPEADNFGG